MCHTNFSSLSLSRSLSYVSKNRKRRNSFAAEEVVSRVSVCRRCAGCTRHRAGACATDAMTGHHMAFFLITIASVGVALRAVDIQPESQALLTFARQFQNPAGIFDTWKEDANPCSGNKPNWEGVLCQDGSIIGLQIENKGLSSTTLNLDSLTTLKNFRTLSLKGNNLNGPMPSIKHLARLRSVYLSNNKFSGEIPSGSFSGMGNLKKVHLSNNRFTGVIPSSLASLPRLLELKLEGNEFNGRIPDFHQKSLQRFNVAGNQLSGEIPAGALSHMDPAGFSGNNLCGEPVKLCRNSLPLTTALMIGIAVSVSVIALLAIFALIFVIIRNYHRSLPVSVPPPVELKKADRDQYPYPPRLTFVREDGDKFELGDLLKASAEILGSGCFGSSYKAVLQSGDAMVVKRFRQMNNAGKDEFQEHMRRLGRLNHPNLLPLLAYYYRKEEKLFVTQYIPNGSLAVRLHGYGSQPSCLDWPTRLKIIKGVAKGLAYLYSELPSLICPHGHLKSSNVLLDESMEPLLADYGLVPVTNPENAQVHMVSYKSPEYRQLGRITKKTDVWCLGVLILETLTGRFPATILQNAGDELDLSNWVSEVEAGVGEGVLDAAISGSSAGECREMLKLLTIGLRCCDTDVEKRSDLKEAVQNIQLVKESDEGDEPQSYQIISLS